MSKRYTKFKSNYLMRSDHQQTELGRIMERDWVTTNGLNPLRFGSGRRIWYNSGNFVFTTSNIPTYHKKHKLSTEVKEWGWDDVSSADGTANEVTPSFNTNDIRDYAYYGSCVELIRATIEEIIDDFPGCLVSSNEIAQSNTDTVVVDSEYPTTSPTDGDTSREILWDDNLKQSVVVWYLYENGKWNGPLQKIENETYGRTNGIVGEVYHDLSDNQVKKLHINNKGFKYFENYGIATGLYNVIYHNNGYYYNYNYSNASFETYTVSDGDGVVDGYVLKNQFNIDLHHKLVKLGEYDNRMRFMAQSWTNYCVIKNGDTSLPKMMVVKKFKTIGEDGKEKEYKENEIVEYENYVKLTVDEKENLRQSNSIKSYVINDGFEDKKCPSNNEGRIMKTIKIETYDGNTYTINAYSVFGEIVYTYKGTASIRIQPIKSYIDEYFTSLKGFKKQLLRQDTRPYYSNRFITPIEKNFIMYYPERLYIWPSEDYCIDITSMAFSSFVEKLYDMGQAFDELWTDNIYRSMTHEAIKNFDWTYSREYYKGDAQDNIDGGERMQKILRVMGRAFDDVKLYIDTIKCLTNTTYDRIKNGPEALMSDNNNIKGIDVISTISSEYDIDTSIETSSLSNVSKVNWWSSEKDDDKTIKYSSLPRWYTNRHSEDIYPDVCDNEIMRRLSLSAKRIMQTKGTQQGIEMMLGLFGLGKDVDYEIEEEAYYTENMINTEECVDGTMDDNAMYSGEDWTDATGDWKSVDNHKKGSLAYEINANKSLDLLYYSDPLSGTPMKTVTLGRDYTIKGEDNKITSKLAYDYLVPYYDSQQLYDNDLIFQGKGGWGKMIKKNDNDLLDDNLDYQETLSYLHVAGTIGDMLSVNPNTVEANTIYYIANLNDYTDYDENPPMDIDNGVTMSHFFVLFNHYEPHKFYSWKNIVVKTELDGNGKLQKVSEESFKKIFGTDDTRDWYYSPNDLPEIDKDNKEKVLGTYKYIFAKMQYLDNIISTNIANNPHVGYGKYDDGEQFIEYMKLPFKYLIDNTNLLPNSALYSLASKYNFYDIGDIKVNDKIQIMNTSDPHNYSDCRTDYVEYRYIDNNSNGSGYDNVVIDKPNYVRDKDKYNTVKRWYINTKILTITNKVNLDTNGLFSHYFKYIIMPYLMQVIPSTTILKLKDFTE